MSLFNDEGCIESKVVNIKDNLGYYDQYYLWELSKIKEPCIYFLIKCSSYCNNRVKREVVYVGQSKRGIERVFEHKNKNFDSFVIIPTEEKYLDYYEKYYIEKYMPCYNKQIKANIESVKWSRIKKAINEMN